MTDIGFHFNVKDRSTYACRLLRKAVRAGVKPVVCGPAPVLAALDQALWSFDPVEFLPHLLIDADQPLPARAALAPVWLVERASAVERHQLLVNLGPEPPECFASYDRLIEIVSADDAERADARARWKHYVARGYALERHEVAA